MRKLPVILFLAIIFAVTSGNLFARDNDAFKNNLLKVELNKISENTYDVGLYTQKAYNEPVKVVKKSDNYYYLLLPETSHAITSISPTGDIKNVSIKSYPYAGQDVENGYTKIGISTTKEVNLTTSLRTIDTSVSPRLDPIRLAKLDQAFERYSQRLADNNIPTQLAKFRKQTAVQTPEMQGEVSVKSPDDLIAAKTPDVKESLEPVEKVVKEPVKTVVKKPAKQAVKKTQSVKKPANRVVNKVVNKPAKKTVSKPAKIAQAKPVQTKPVQVIQPKPVEEVQESVKSTIQTIVQKPAQKSAVNKAAQKSQAKPVQSRQLRPKADTKETVPVEKQKIAQVQPSVPVEIKTKPQKTESEKIPEIKEPVKIDMGKTAIKEDIKTKSSDIKETTAKKEDVKQEPAGIPVKVGTPVKMPVQPKQPNNLPTLAVAFVCLLAAYILTKVNAAKKSARDAVVHRMAAEVNGNIKELLRERTTDKAQLNEAAEQEAINAPLPEQMQADVQNSAPQFNQMLNQPSEVQTASVPPQEPIADTPYADYNQAPELAEAIQKQADNEANRPEIAAMIEKMVGANRNTDSISTDNINYENIDADEVLEQLYTPIEDTPGGYAVYNEANYAPLLSSEEPENNDVATIVASSKLTETRGLYLAKFEGSTSLVGYIQDDIYVLYNFDDSELQGTDLESKLAKESETDSLYIVSTGGKKLMVKSTPYDMSLEMVM